MSGSVRNDVLAILDKTEAEIAAAIKTHLAGLTWASANSVKKVNRLIKEITLVRGNAWDEIESLWTDTFKDFTVKEVEFATAAIKAALPVVLKSPPTPTAKQLKDLVRTHLFEGRTLSKWAENIRKADISRIEAQIKIGMSQNEPSHIIARRIVGTAKLKGRDGVMQITRKNADSITRTATIAYSNASRALLYDGLKDVFEKELYVATLDGRTTAICQSLDGERFSIGEGPMPPVHFNCRSLRIAVVTEDAIGTRPTKPTTEKGLLREYTKQRGFSPVTKRSQLPRGTKGAFDTFSARRARELIGHVPAKTTYGQWLSTQSIEFQDDVLGTTKGKLFRKGGLKLDRFVNRRGDEIPLSQLAASDAKAFKAAGLDPKDYTN